MATNGGVMPEKMSCLSTTTMPLSWYGTKHEVTSSFSPTHTTSAYVYLRIREARVSSIYLAVFPDEYSIRDKNPWYVVITGSCDCVAQDFIKIPGGCVYPIPSITTPYAWGMARWEPYVALCSTGAPPFCSVRNWNSSRHSIFWLGCNSLGRYGRSLHFYYCCGAEVWCHCRGVNLQQIYDYMFQIIQTKGIQGLKIG